MYKRKLLRELQSRFSEKRKFIQVLAGPRQTGKTTLAMQISKNTAMPVKFYAADEPVYKGAAWIEQSWETARAAAKVSGKGALLIIDEIQKISGWEETVKKLWDEDTRENIRLYVLLLGSSAMLLRKGLGESLAGRFEIVHVTHWSFIEMKEAFGYTMEEYIFYGGYPGSAAVKNSRERWKSYINESLIESTLSKDILQMARIDKPALLKSLFHLGCAYSGRVLSYQKIAGQLQDAGNTTTLAHYLSLLTGAGMLAGLQKYAGQKARQRASSPKFQVMNNALMSVQHGQDIEKAMKDSDYRGHLIESAVGAHLINSSAGKGMEIFYWAAGDCELDFVLVKGGKIAAIEVKSGRTKDKMQGMERFAREFGRCRKYLIGTGGIPIEEFLSSDPEEML